MKDFDKLREGLLANHTFPTKYMFKFVVPNTPEKSDELKSLFPSAELTTNLSKTGKYISYTAVVKMDSVDEIILIYRKAGTIEGVLAL